VPSVRRLASPAPKLAEGAEIAPGTTNPAASCCNAQHTGQCDGFFAGALSGTTARSLPTRDAEQIALSANREDCPAAATGRWIAGTRICSRSAKTPSQAARLNARRWRLRNAITLGLYARNAGLLERPLVLIGVLRGRVTATSRIGRRPFDRSDNRATRRAAPRPRRHADRYA